MTIIETIRARKSCRTYTDRPVDPALLAELKGFLETNTQGPFGAAVRFVLLDFRDLTADEIGPLGTYGVIKGATLFIAGVVAKGPKASEDYGFCMERNILKATELGLGTCWLGGTFKRRGFAGKMALSADEFLPAITPVGYPGEKRSLTDRFFRFSAGSDQRKPWSDLFFDGNIGIPLRRELAGGYELPLECVRIGPSASNKQPWRIIREGGAFHFYLSRTPGYDKLTRGLPLQDVDMGIAMCHFELSARELGLKGDWKVQDIGPAVKDMEYVATWMIPE